MWSFSKTVDYHSNYPLYVSHQKIAPNFTGYALQGEKWKVAPGILQCISQMQSRELTPSISSFVVLGCIIYFIERR